MSIKESYLDLYCFFLNFLKFRLLSWSIRDFASSKDVKLSGFSWSRVLPEKEVGETRCLANFITSRAERSGEVVWWNFRKLNSSILFKSRFWPIRSEKPNLTRNNSWRFITITYFCESLSFYRSSDVPPLGSKESVTSSLNGSADISVQFSQYNDRIKHILYKIH